MKSKGFRVITVNFIAADGKRSVARAKLGAGLLEVA